MLEHAQAPVRLAAVVQARDRLLARVAALREADRALDQARLGGQDAVVELAAQARRAGADPQQLELVVGDGSASGSASSTSTAGTP